LIYFINRKLNNKTKIKSSEKKAVAALNETLCTSKNDTIQKLLTPLANGSPFVFHFSQKPFDNNNFYSMIKNLPFDITNQVDAKQNPSPQTSNNQIRTNLAKNLTAQNLNQTATQTVTYSTQNTGSITPTAELKPNPQITLFTNAIDRETLIKLKTIQNIDIEIFTLPEIYSKLKEEKALPEQTITYKNNAKFTLKLLITQMLSRKNAKSYFFFGLIMFFSATFISLGLYYRIFSFISFTLAILCLFNIPTTIKNRKNKKLNPPNPPQTPTTNTTMKTPAK
jgi:hypothetical protein